MSGRFDLAVVGAGISASPMLRRMRRGLSVVVVDREARAIGASVRNFGFVTSPASRLANPGAAPCAPATSGPRWRRRPVSPSSIRACSSSPAARSQWGPRGVRRHRHGRRCALLDAGESRRRHGATIANNSLEGFLWSPHELRVESRCGDRQARSLDGDARGQLFGAACQCTAWESGRLDTSDGPIAAEHVVVCPGDDLMTLFSERIRALRNHPLPTEHVESSTRGRLPSARFNHVRPLAHPLSWLC